MSNAKYRFAGSFSGTGGIELGFQQAGFEVVWANEIDEPARKTYSLNFGGGHLDPRSIWDIDPQEVPDHEVFGGGFPCQPFSRAGEGRGLLDDRGNLFLAVARILSYKRPPAFLLENVKGLVGHDGGRTLSVILGTLRDLGYRVDYRVLNSAIHGNVPQGRERVYIVGVLQGMPRVVWPSPVPLTVKVSDLLDPAVDRKYFYDSRYGKITEEVTRTVQDDAVYQWRKTYVRRNQSGVCPTLTANMGTGGHNVPIVLDPLFGTPRKLTPRECFRVQGYPDSYNLPDLADGHLYKQAGNAVSVPVVKRLAESIGYTLDQANVEALQEIL